MIKYLDLKSQYESLKSEMDAAIHAVISESAFVGGKYVSAFEKEFANFCAAKNCVGVANGTDALELSLEALDLPAGSEVIVPAYTFIATAEAVVRCGLTPVFCDINEDDYCLSIADLKKRITPKTSAVIVVHLYGHPCDMDAVNALAVQHKFKIIEDCAQAHGALYKNKKIGTLGDVATFSFYPGKNLGAYGDGGAVVTNNEVLAKKIRKLSNHGREDKYRHDMIGRNSRLDGLQAAVLSVKLKHLEVWNERRRSVAQIYNRELAGVEGVILPQEQEGARSVFHLYVIRAQRRDELIRHLSAHEIETGVHYPLAVHQQPAFHNHPQFNEKLFAANLGSQVLSLPMGEHLSEAQVKTVCHAIKEFYS